LIVFSRHILIKRDVQDVYLEMIHYRYHHCFTWRIC